MAWALKCDICGRYEDLVDRYATDLDYVKTKVDGVEIMDCTCRKCTWQVKNFIEDLKEGAHE